MKHCKLLAHGTFGLLVLVGFLVGPSWAQVGDNLIVNGGFEDPVLEAQAYLSFEDGSSLGGWTVSNNDEDGYGGVVLIRNWWQPAEGNQSLGLKISSSNGRISQDIATEIDMVYMLTFRLAGDPDMWPRARNMEVCWDGQVAQTYTFDVTDCTRSDMRWTYYELVLPTATSELTTLSFAATDYYYSGPALDDVCLYALHSNAPEPASLSLLVLGGIFLRRIKKMK